MRCSLADPEVLEIFERREGGAQARIGPGKVFCIFELEVFDIRCLLDPFY